MINYIGYSFTVFPKEPATEILIAELGEAGFESFVENDNGVTAYIQKQEWNSKILDDLYTERDELEENIDALKEKDNDQYGLVPEDRHSHYKMTVFKSIHGDTNGNTYAVGTEGEVDDSIEEYSVTFAYQWWETNTTT
mgnify:CR=1 FL=1